MLQRDTVAIPVTKGVNVTTRARLLPASDLLEAKNSRFSGSGSTKRAGHADVRVRSGAYPAAIPEFQAISPQLTPYGEKIVSPDWLYGWGFMTSQNAFDQASLLEGNYPEAGHLVGGGTRDNELLSWNGHRLFSYTPSEPGNMVAFPATMPALRAKPVAKSNYAQDYPDVADSGRMRVLVWRDSVNDYTRYTVLDSVTGATLLKDEAIDDMDGLARVVSMGTWFHIIGCKSNSGFLQTYSFNESDISPDSATSRSFGDCVEFWDMWKVDETLTAILTNDGSEASDPLRIFYIGQTGQDHPDYSAADIDTDGEIIDECSVCIYPLSGRPGISWVTNDISLTPNMYQGGVFNIDGSQYGNVQDFLNLEGTGYETSPRRCSIAPKWLYNDDGTEQLDAYLSVYNGTQVKTHRFYFGLASGFGAVSVYHLSLASHAFRVGDRTFIWAANKSTLQSLWVLLDSNLTVVGALDFESANAPDPMAAIHLPNLNFTGTNTVKDRLVYHLALGYRQRVPTTDDQVGLYTENSAQFVELDFLPRLRSAQAGRCAYMAGAQLWQYDGAELVEAGFHLAPEFTLTEAGGGALTLSGTYSYRVDLCYRNAQNEEVRSHSLLVQKTLTGANRTITLSIKPGLTRRSNAYLLVFRNAMISGAPTTTWNLINSRDPASAQFTKNDQTAAFISYSDAGAVTDVAGQGKELHPGNNSAFLYPFAAPACEIVAAGADRLWVAGGELPAGQVAPSRLFDPGEIPAFNANINRQVDRGDEAITAVGFIGAITVVFRDQAAYILDGDGPDNYASGYWSPPRLALADSGAISQESLALTSGALIFQSRAGLRSIGPGGAFNSIGQGSSFSSFGQPVDTVMSALDVRGAVVVPKYQEVRWYGDTQTVVYNYVEQAWSTWSVTGAGAVFNKNTGLAAVFNGLGALWIEQDGTYLDAGTPYEHRIRFPWLHAGGLGDFQRIRRISGLGEWDGIPHSVRVEMYYDEREHLAEYWEWDVPDTSQNNDAWGDNSWGSGVWGDTQDATLHDSVWRWRRRPRRQKCSVFSVVVSDRSSEGPGFVLTALGLELARKPGLDRIPSAGGTNVNLG